MAFTVTVRDTVKRVGKETRVFIKGFWGNKGGSFKTS